MSSSSVSTARGSAGASGRRSDASQTLPSKVITPRFESEEFFGHQPSSRAELPDPEPMVVNIAHCIVEVLAGARDLEQLARWVTDDVYAHLLKRDILAKRARAATGRAPVRPSFTVGGVRLCEPRDGVVEGVVVVHGRARSRSVCVRLEGLDRRWRATAINVL